MSIKLILVSERDHSEFTSLVSWLRQKHGLTTACCFPDITTALSRLPPADKGSLTVVLQAWSDQYIPADVDRIVGATLKSELICVYGAWCESDGRSRPVWPHSKRVPLRYARSTIETALSRLQAGLRPLPATASRDETFLFREPEIPEVDADSRGTALVVSPDRTLRQTWCSLLKLCGWDSEPASLEQFSRMTSGRYTMIVHDLDPDDTRVKQSLEHCRAAFGSSRFVGMASLPGNTSHARLGDDDPVILPKLDPLRSICQLLRDAA